VTELTAERTLALRDKLASTPAVAFQAVLHKFCLDVFSRYFSHGTAMEVSVRSASFPVQAQGLKDTSAAKAIDARHKAWEERLPKDKADLWDWLTTLTGDEQATLFAHCASFGVNALYEKGDRYGAGVFVSIDAEGTLSVDRGYVRPQDEAPVGEPEQDGETDPATAGADHIEPDAPVVQRAVITIGGQIAGPEDEDDEDLKPLPDRLVTELTAERTLALRDKLASTPAVAFQAVLHKFCLDVFSRYFSYGTAMEVSVRSASFPVQAQGLKDTPAAKAIDARHKVWEERLPKDKADLWDWLTTLTGEEQAALFAHCASFGVNALYEKGDRYGAGVSSHTVEQRIAEADRLAQAVDLDMVQAGWRPTVENYLGRVPKRRILEAVQEGAGERAAQLIDHMKKGDMAKEAERLLADTGWLPEPLRIATTDDAPVETAEAEDDGEALPEFLAGDDEETEADAPQVIAAE
jgi:ParB family chromosome partitioning protein